MGPIRRAAGDSCCAGRRPQVSIRPAGRQTLRELMPACARNQRVLVAAGRFLPALTLTQPTQRAARPPALRGNDRADFLMFFEMAKRQFTPPRDP